MAKTAAPATARAINLAPLDTYIGYAVRRAQISISDDLTRDFGALRLTPAQFGVLCVVAGNPGLNQSEVAASLGIQRANFVVLINRLQKRGLVDRRPMDRRSYALHLSAEGAALLKRAVAAQNACDALLEARLGPGGRAKLLRLLARLA